MAQVKGKFIQLAGYLMALYKDAQQKADDFLKSKVGKSFNELDPEGFYDAKIFDVFMKEYAKASPTNDKAIVTLGKKVYPTIQKTSGLPDALKTPLDYILFEAEGFLLNHKGADVTPRKFLKKEEKNVIIEAKAPGYDCKLYEGVFLGILEMCGVKTGKVSQVKCIKNGDHTCEFHITW